MRPMDPLDTAAMLPRVSCPITRQLLGSAFSNYGAYGPSAADVPLREWLKEACGIEPEECGMDGTGREMRARLSFGSQFGRLQGEVPHNLDGIVLHEEEEMEAAGFVCVPLVPNLASPPQPQRTSFVVPAE